MFGKRFTVSRGCGASECRREFKTKKGAMHYVAKLVSESILPNGGSVIVNDHTNDPNYQFLLKVFKVNIDWCDDNAVWLFDHQKKTSKIPQ